MSEEKELVQRILSGNVRAFELLVGRYERLVLHVTSRMIDNDDDLKDLCQEVFIKVYRGLETFNFQSKLGTWIARIAYLTAINYLRKTKKERLNLSLSEQPELELYHFSDENPEQLMMAKDTTGYVHRLVRGLPVSYRTVLTLFYLEEFSYPEIQEITGMPEGTVKNYLFRARKLLKEKLEHYLKEE